MTTPILTHLIVPVGSSWKDSGTDAAALVEATRHMLATLGTDPEETGYDAGCTTLDDEIRNMVWRTREVDAKTPETEHHVVAICVRDTMGDGSITIGNLLRDEPIPSWMASGRGNVVSFMLIVNASETTPEAMQKLLTFADNQLKYWLGNVFVAATLEDVMEFPMLYRAREAMRAAGQIPTTK